MISSPGLLPETHARNFAGAPIHVGEHGGITHSSRESFGGLDLPDFTGPFSYRL